MQIVALWSGPHHKLTPIQEQEGAWRGRGPSNKIKFQENFSRASEMRLLLVEVNTEKTIKTAKISEKSSKFWKECSKFFHSAVNGELFYFSTKAKSTFLPYHVKKHHSKLEMDTFKDMLLLSYLALLDNKPRTCLKKYIFRYRNNYFSLKKV